MAQGGYSDRIRVDEKFVFPIPDNISDEDAAPMLCAGLTVYSPLVRNGTGPGKHVGIIGLGGLVSSKVVSWRVYLALTQFCHSTGPLCSSVCQGSGCQGHRLLAQRQQGPGCQAPRSRPGGIHVASAAGL